MRGPQIFAFVGALLLLIACLAGAAFVFLAGGRTNTPAAFVGGATVHAWIGCPSGDLAATDAPTLDARRTALGLAGEVRIADARTLEVMLRGVSGPDVVRALIVPQRLAFTEALDGSVAIEPSGLPPGVTQRPIGRGGELGFFAGSPTELASLAPLAPADARLVVGCTSAPGGAAECEGVFVRSTAALDNDDVESASVFLDELDGAPQVSLVFTPTGASQFSMLTRRLVQRRLAIVLDDRLASTPVVMEEISGGRAVITLGREGSPTTLEAQANALAVALDVGVPLGCRWELQRLE
jgi:hypothetical protein